MAKIDYRKELSKLYNPTAKEVTFIDVPTMNFLMVDGAGDPNNSPQFQAAMEALFSISYTVKFMIKKSSGIDYAVMPAEGLWWVEDMNDFDIERKDQWLWTLMIMQPEMVTDALITQATDEVRRKKGTHTLLDQVRFEAYSEGKSVQIMHLGPFSAEGPTVARLHDFLTEHGFELGGKHHEIYLSDFRKAAPERLKTVIRQPICPNV